MRTFLVDFLSWLYYFSINIQFEDVNYINCMNAKSLFWWIEDTLLRLGQRRIIHSKSETIGGVYFSGKKIGGKST